MSDKPLEQSIFLTALELATPAEREAYLRGACGNNEALRAAVAELLAAHERAGNILDAPPVAVGGTVAQDRPGAGSLEQPGVNVGNYKLIEPIGEGGMGAVWMAQQTEPVRRLVALKLIKAGMDSRQVIARFEAERQALALMDHPNIARVLDGGTTPSGRPYFVMDLVKGVPITRYCDEHHRTPRQRLELFIPVCQAVQHAHQKGIIHRDLKPSNVLVARYDGRPVPKIIDFGVAKAAGQSLTDKTLVTGCGSIVGTLEYMSPEQAEVNQLDIDTRSDIYSLGVLLYELLAGSPPFSRKELEKAGMLEMLRMIRELEPSKPSTKLSTAEGLPMLAANRGTEPAKLTSLVRGELDWIVMKALEKDRSRRYETANSFAMDLQRYLADEQVQACPPSVAYRLRKFARRNRATVVTAAAILFVLLVGIVGTTFGLISAEFRRVEAERARSNEAAQRLIADTEAARARAQERTARFNLYTARLKLVEYNLEAGHTGRAMALLEADRPRAGQEDLRAFEWYYLWRQCHLGLRFTLREHRDTVSSVAFSPDGLTLASASLESTVRLWDVATGRVRTTLEHNDRVRAVAYSPDGNTLASGAADNTITLWNLVTRQPRSQFRGPDAILQVTFSSDGKTLASAGNAGSLILWDSSTGNMRLNLKQPRPVQSLSFSPDGKTLASVTIYGGVKLWDLDTGKERVTFPGHRWGSHAIAFSSDGNILASAGSESVKLLNPITGQEKTRLRGQPSYVTSVTSVAFSPNSELVALGSHNGDVILWKPATGQTRVYGHTAGPVLTVAFSRDGKTLASAGADKSVKLWQTTLEPERSVLTCGGCVWTVGVSPDGKTIATGGDGGLKLWDMATEREIETLQRGDVLSLAFSPDGRTLASAEPTVKFWDLATKKEQATLGDRRSNWCVTFSPDGKTLAVANFNGTVELWDVVLRKQRATLKCHTRWVYSVAFSPDGKTLASGSYGSGDTLKLWDVATGKEILAISGHDGSNINSVVFAPDGKTVISGRGRNGAMKVWDAATGRELASLMGPSGLPNSAGIVNLPGRDALATGTFEGSLKLWDLPSGHERAALKGHTLQVSSLAATFDGKVVVSGSYDGTVKIWRAATEDDVQAQSCVRDYRSDLASDNKK